MPCYSAYGLIIDSEIPLPNIATGEGTVDLVIRCGPVPEQPREEFIAHLYYAVTNRVVHYVWRDVGTFRVSEGQEILVERAPEAEDLAVTNLLLGPMLAIIMHQRGRLVLHAAAVERNGAVVAFAADTGEGKSTTAAAFLRAGYPLVADDLLGVVMEEDGPPHVFTANPQMKLWPQSIEALGGSHEGLTRVVGPRDKRYYDVGGRMSSGRLPVGVIYALARGERNEIRDLAPNEAMLELVRNSYCAPLLGMMGDEARHFMLCARLAAQVPVKRLVREMGLERLDELVRVVEGEGKRAKGEG